MRSTYLPIRKISGLFLVALLFMAACSGPRSVPANSQAGRAVQPGEDNAAQSEQDAQESTLGDGVLVLERFESDIEKTYSVTINGEIPFTLHSDGQEVKGSGEGKYIYDWNRPVVGGIPSCNLYIEAKALLSLDATFSLPSSPQDVCRLKGKVSWVLTTPEWSTTCPHGQYTDPTAVLRGYSATVDINIPIHPGATDSRSLSTNEEAAQGDERVQFSPLLDQMTHFSLKNLHTGPGVCQAPTPTP